MRISDWSSDVCSSDLTRASRRPSRKIRHCQLHLGRSWLAASPNGIAGPAARPVLGSGRTRKIEQLHAGTVTFRLQLDDAPPTSPCQPFHEVGGLPPMRRPPPEPSGRIFPYLPGMKKQNT